MAEFLVNVPQLREAAEAVAELAKILEPEIAEISRRGDEVYSCLSGESATGISEQLKGLSEELAEQKRNIEAMAAVLFHVCDMYQKTEEEVTAWANILSVNNAKITDDGNAELRKDETVDSYDSIANSSSEEANAKKMKSLFKSIIKQFGTLDFRFLLNEHIRYLSEGRVFAAEDKTDYKSSMGQLFGFSEDAEKLLEEAYRKFYNSSDTKDMDNRERINFFFSRFAALNEEYSSASKVFWACGDNPSTEEALSYFNDMGIDGEKLKDALLSQHKTAFDLKVRDFIHECAIYSVMGNDGVLKSLAGFFDNVDALVGYKGDVYTAKMPDDDRLSDIAGVNTYNRMVNCEDGDIWRAMSE